MLKIIAHDILWSLRNAVIMDDTADISIKEQMPISFRIVQKNFETQSYICEFFNAAGTRAATPFSILNNALCGFNLAIENHVGNAMMVQQIWEDSTVGCKHSYNRKSSEHCTCNV